MIDARKTVGENRSDGRLTIVDQDGKREIDSQIANAMNGARHHQCTFGTIIDGIFGATRRMIRHVDRLIDPHCLIRGPSQRPKQKPQNREAQQELPDCLKQAHAASLRERQQA